MNTQSRPSRGSTASAVRTISSSAGDGPAMRPGRAGRGALGHRVGPARRSDNPPARTRRRRRRAAPWRIDPTGEIARQQEQLLRAAPPGFAHPAIIKDGASADGSTNPTGAPRPALEHARTMRARAAASSSCGSVRASSIHRKLAFFQHPVNRILVRCLHALRRDAERFGRRLRRTARSLGHERALLALAARQARRRARAAYAVAPPVERERPARHRLARIPFAEPVMQQALRREALRNFRVSASANAHALARTEHSPFHSGDSHVVDRHEGRLAAHRQPHPGPTKVGIDLFAEAHRAPAQAIIRRTAA